MDLELAKEPAHQALTLSLVRLPGTTRRFLKAQVVGFLTAGLIEDDTFEPERFVIRVADRSGRSWGDIEAGENPQTATETLALFEERSRTMTMREFLTVYHLRDKTSQPPSS